MKRIISFLLTFVILVTAFDVPASAYYYFDMYGTDNEIIVNDSVYDLMGKARAGATELDLTSTVKLEKQKFNSIIGSKNSTKFARFEFTLKKKDTVTFTIETSTKFRSDCTAIFIFNNDHEYFYEAGFKRTSKNMGRTYKDSVTLSKGTYFLFIATEKYSTGTIDLKVSAPKHKETKPTFKVTAKSGGKAVVKWNKVPNATKYRVSSYKSGKFKTIKTTTKTSYTVKNLVKGNKYSYIVSAYVNGKWTTLNPSNAKSIYGK